LLTLDYELFFGKNPGSVDACILSPTNDIIRILDKYGVKASFFVDAGYIERLEQERKLFPELENDYQQIKVQISTLFKEGHDVQLHIHPHWKDSFYSENGWKIDVSRYRLHDFSKQDVGKIVSDYKHILEKTINDKIFVFRAGGWCIQPFDHIAEALSSNGVFIDSTIYKNGINQSETHSFDFTTAENKTFWNFNQDPNREEINGRFCEMPISSIRTNPLFFWRLAFAKKFGGKRHIFYGNGGAVKASRTDIARMLTRYTSSVVSMDGYKASLLKKSLKIYQRNYGENDYFIIIGHPKSTTAYSLEKLDEFLEEATKNNFFTTYRQEFKNNEIGSVHV